MGLLASRVRHLLSVFAGAMLLACVLVGAFATAAVAHVDHSAKVAVADVSSASQAHSNGADACVDDCASAVITTVSADQHDGLSAVSGACCGTACHGASIDAPELKLFLQLEPLRLKAAECGFVWPQVTFAFLRPPRG